MKLYYSSLLGLLGFQTLVLFGSLNVPGSLLSPSQIDDDGCNAVATKKMRQKCRPMQSNTQRTSYPDCVVSLLYCGDMGLPLSLLLLFVLVVSLVCHEPTRTRAVKVSLECNLLVFSRVIFSQSKKIVRLCGFHLSPPI